MKGKANKTGINAYKKNQEHSVSPLQKILYVMEVAVRSAQRRDGERLKKILQVLRSGLNYSKYPEVAIGLERLYVYCDQMVEEENFKEALRVLVTLKRTWMESEKFSKAPMLPEDGGKDPREST